MAMRRTFMKLERYDVHPALKKLWKKHYNVDGQVTQHLSPFEQNVASPMFKDWPTKVYKKLTDFLFEAGPGLGLGIAVFYWGEAQHKSLAFHHRS